MAFLPFVSVCLTGKIPKPYLENPRSLGEHLKKRRHELGLFQKDVARLLGVNQWTLILWETDQARPFPRTYARIVGFLGYDPSPAPRTLGEWIRARRRELGMTTRQLAARVGWDEGTVRRYELDAWVPTSARRAALEEVLGDKIYCRHLAAAVASERSGG